jgi:hypothetical protein
MSALVFGLPAILKIDQDCGRVFPLIRKSEYSVVGYRSRFLNIYFEIIQYGLLARQRLHIESLFLISQVFTQGSYYVV